jgi:type II secretory pathway component PulF
MRYSYVAMDDRGKEQRGFVEANSATEASHLVRDGGLFPTSISEAGEHVAEPQAAREGPVETMDAAMGTMAASCAAMMNALVNNGFRREEAVELVKVFLSKAIETGMAKAIVPQ